MTALIFLICTFQGECQIASIDQVFRSETQCEVAAQMTLDSVQDRIDNGLMPDHYRTHRCVNFGSPT